MMFWDSHIFEMLNATISLAIFQMEKLVDADNHWCL